MNTASDPEQACARAYGAEVLRECQAAPVTEDSDEPANDAQRERHGPSAKVSTSAKRSTGPTELTRTTPFSPDVADRGRNHPLAHPRGDQTILASS
jgi:hypothetical protein